MGFMQKPHGLMFPCQHFCTVLFEQSKAQIWRSPICISTTVLAGICWQILGGSGSENSSIYKLKYSSVYDCCVVVIEIEWSVCSLALSWKRKVGNNIWNEELACNYLYREFTCSTRTAAGWPEPTAWRHCFDKKRTSLTLFSPKITSFDVATIV